MKKLALLLVALCFITSCSIEGDDTIPFHIEFVKTESVEMPEYFTPGNTYEIKVNYRKPTDCHYFDGFYYGSEGSVRTVAIQTIVIEDANCQVPEADDTEQASFDFKCVPGYAGDSYTFKFYTGDNEAGQQEFLVVEVPVHQ